MNSTCSKCQNLGLCFYSDHIYPQDYLEGNMDSDIWIIGLNPKANIGHIEKRSKSDFSNFNPEIHPYFKDFKKVSKRLYENWTSINSNVAHTDLVKCFSNEFPPKLKPGLKSNRAVKREIVNNCSEHLYAQIQLGKPKLIICNGSPVSWEMIRLFPPVIEVEDYKSLTSYHTGVSFKNGDSHKFWIVLSGFIGRIDDWSKRRLGLEIEEILDKQQILY